MSRCLVVYYSWSGKTAKVAKALAETLAADVEEIKDAKPRAGLFAFIRSAVEASQQKPAPILPGATNVADYDAVILGCPVWAQNMASPMRSYILREKDRIRRLAVFCTFGGSGGEAALARIGALSGQAPIAELQVRASDFASGRWRSMAETFARSVQDKAARRALASA
jgi:flavodoxin